MRTTADTRHLFLDDHILEEMAGLTRTLHQPRKQGPVLKAEQPWEGQYIGVFSPPMWIPDEGVYKQIYECRYAEPGRPHRYALAVSEDGVQWNKPDLGLVEFHGSRHNNLFPTPDDRRLVHVVYDPDDAAPGRRYKGLLTVPKARVPVVSGDGLHWEKLDVELPSGDAGTMAFDRANRLFMAMLKRPNPATVGRSYDVSFSHDFAEWSEPRFMFGMDHGRDQEMAVDTVRRRLANTALAKPLFIDPDPGLGWQHPDAEHHTPTWRCECYNFGVVPYAGLYLGMITVYYPTGQRMPERANADGFNLIQLAVSRDLKQWQRLGERQPFIEPSPVTEGLTGNYDRLQLAAYNGVVQHGDEVRVYYDGMKRRVPQHDRWSDGSPRESSTLSDGERADWLEDTHSAMCLATLRRDGFVSLDGGAAGGHVVTKSLQLEGSRLFLNVDAAPGQARVSLLDESGEPMPGWSAEQAARVEGNNIRMPVRWANGHQLTALGGRTVRLHIELEQARLYSLWTE